MTKFNKLTSLKLKMVYVTLLGFAVVIGLFYALRMASEYYISNIYMSEENIQERKENYIESFASYVERNKLSKDDQNEIARWCRSQRYVYLWLYDDTKLIYETEIDKDDPTWSDILNDDSLIIKDADGNLIPPDKEKFPVRFYNPEDESGTEEVYCLVSLMEFTESYTYNVSLLLSVFTCFVIFVAIMLVYISRITKKVTRLAGEVDKIEHGNLEHKIESVGNDELAMLSENVDRMRLSIIEQLNNKEIAWKANNELITSLSHDFRNPLTSLLGYLEILDGKLYESEAEREEFVSACMSKASQLKDLSDDLFQYFLVFGAQEVAVRKEEYDAEILFEQLFSEAIIYLESLGFRLRYRPIGNNAKVSVDVQLLKRVVDNLVSNLVKYADSAKEIVININRNGNEIKIDVINTVKSTPANVTSTKIGLKTCEKIVSQMGGDFRILNNGKQFTATVVLPL